MSIERCAIHSRHYDTDYKLHCPLCATKWEQNRILLDEKVQLWIDDLTDGEVEDLLGGSTYPLTLRSTRQPSTERA